MCVVTLITVTQYKRLDFLDLLFESTSKAICCANNCSVLEWIFVDGSNTKKQSELVQKKLNQLKKQYNLNVKYYIPDDNKRNIGYLREFSNSKVKPETNYVIVQDDDDLMLPTRIQKTVELFQQHNDCQLIGTGDVFMYDYDSNVTFTFRKELHPPNHAINSTFAYTYKYLQENHYDVDKAYAEEGSFTKTDLGDFTQKMYHLSPYYSIVQISHSINTYNKFIVKTQALSMAQYGLDSLSVVTKPEIPLEHLMGNEFANKYRKLCSEKFEKIRDKKEYDITYYCGVHSIEWDPRNLKSLGGSESAIIHLCENWARKKKVQVFLNMPELEFKLEPLVHKGVTYKHCNKFSFRDHYKTLILWRVSGLFILNPHVKINADKICVDLHDHNPEQNRMMFDAQYNSIDKIFYKSHFHKDIADQQFKVDKLSNQKAVIIPNGVEVDLFTYNSDIVKEPFRFQYSSSYFRGLKEILKYMWPKIIERIPNAELHLYYGFFDSDPIDERKEIEDLIKSSTNVTDHGRVDRSFLAIEKMKASYHLYPSLCTAEICCISLKESLLADNVLILSDKFLFANFPGIKLNHHHSMSLEEYYTQGGVDVCDAILSPENKEKLDILRVTGKSYDQIKTWSDVSKLWLSNF